MKDVKALSDFVYNGRNVQAGDFLTLADTDADVLVATGQAVQMPTAYPAAPAAAEVGPLPPLLT